MNNEYDSGEEAAVETLLGMARKRDQSNRNIPSSSPRHSESELKSDIETDTPYSRRRRLRRRQMRVGFADPLHQDTPDNVVQARLAPAVGRRPIKKATKSNSKGSSTSDNGRAASSKTTKSAKTTTRAGPTKAQPVAAAKKRKQTKAVSFPPSTPTPARGRTFIISDNDDSSDGQDEVDSTDGVVELPRKRLKRGSVLANVQGFGTGSQPGISSPIASPAANSASQSTNKIYNLFGKTMKIILTLIPYLDGLALPKKMTAASLADINREKILEVAQSIAKSQAMKRFEPLVYHHETKASFSAAKIDSRTKPVVENDIDLSTDNDAKEFRAVLHYQYHELNLQNLKITIEVKYGTTFEPLPTPVPILRQSTTAASSGSTLSLAHPLTPAVQAITTANTDKSALVTEITQRWKCTLGSHRCPARSLYCWPNPQAENRHMEISDRITKNWAELIRISPTLHSIETPPAPIQQQLFTWDQQKQAQEARNTSKSKRSSTETLSSQPGPTQNFNFGFPSMGMTPWGMPPTTPMATQFPVPPSSPVSSVDGFTVREFCRWIGQGWPEAQREELIKAGEDLDNEGYTIGDANLEARRNPIRLAERLNIKDGYLKSIGSKKLFERFKRSFINPPVTRGGG